MDGKTILVVDDDQDVRALLVSLLSSLKVDVTAVQSAEEAIKLCSLKKFDLILMDWHMPGGDGFEAASKIWCETELNADTKIIICSASDTPTEVEACMRHGFAEVFSKCFDLESLRRLLSRHLSEA